MAKRKTPEPISPSETEREPVIVTYDTEMVAIADLKPHPRNYRKHGDDQIAHIVESINEHGVYRNVVVARDGTILAGHGVVLAARKNGMSEIPVHRVDVDPNEPRALKIMAGDNEISRLAFIDDRVLSEILKEIKNTDPIGLLGTGYDEQMLAALAFVTRSEDEIADFDEAAHWVGMPEYDPGSLDQLIVIIFETPEERDDFLTNRIGVEISATKINKKGNIRSLRWPLAPREDLDALRFEDAES